MYTVRCGSHGIEIQDTRYNKQNRPNLNRTFTVLVRGSWVLHVVCTPYVPVCTCRGERGWSGYEIRISRILGETVLARTCSWQQYFSVSSYDLHDMCCAPFLSGTKPETKSKDMLAEKRKRSKKQNEAWQCTSVAVMKMRSTEYERLAEGTNNSTCNADDDDRNKTQDP